jgi:hypothetical protein
MSASEQPTRFGQISPPDEAWLARQPPEPILDPDLPIIDPHHHLWDRPQHRYLLDEFLADVRTGHHLIATVFEECHPMYRASGPEELRSVGKTEFVAGVAAMSASGGVSTGLMPKALRPLLQPQPTQADGRPQLQPFRLLAGCSKSLQKAGLLDLTCTR